MTTETTTITQRAHEAAIAAYQAATRLTNPDLFEAAMRAAHLATVARVIEIIRGDLPAVGQTVATIDGTMTIARWGGGRIEEIDRGDAVEVQLTSDGLIVDRTAWHTGDPDPDERDVYYEAWTIADGKLVDRAHGWADRRTRRITQSG